MVPTNDGRDIRPGPLDCGVWVRSVSDQIAEAQDPVVFALRVGQDGIQRFQVSVNVADNQDRHRRRSATSGGAPRRSGSAIVPIPRDTKIDESPFRYRPSTNGVKNLATFKS